MQCLRVFGIVALAAILSFAVTATVAADETKPFVIKRLAVVRFVDSTGNDTTRLRIIIESDDNAINTLQLSLPFPAASGDTQVDFPKKDDFDKLFKQLTDAQSTSALVTIRNRGANVAKAGKADTTFQLVAAVTEVKK